MDKKQITITFEVLNIILNEADCKVNKIEPLCELNSYRVFYEDCTIARVTVYPENNGSYYEWEK